MKIFSVLLLVSISVLFSLSFSSCKKYKNYPTIIRVINDFSGETIYIGSKHEDKYKLGETKTLGYLFGSSNEDYEKDYTIDWSDDYYQDLKPRTNKMYVYRVSTSTLINTQSIYFTEVGSESFKLKPGRVYLYDANNNEIIDTGERTDKYEKPGLFSGSGCGSLSGTYSLKRVNGNSLPYTESGSTAKITSGKVTFSSDDTWSSELNYTNMSNGESGETLRNGTYDCDGGSGSLMNSGQVGGSYSKSGGVVTVMSGQTSMEYE